MATAGLAQAGVAVGGILDKAESEAPDGVIQDGLGVEVWDADVYGNSMAGGTSGHAHEALFAALEDLLKVDDA